MSKVLQIGYEPERDRFTWDGWDIHCDQGLEVLLLDCLGGSTWRAVSFEYNDDSWYMPGQSPFFVPSSIKRKHSIPLC